MDLGKVDLMSEIDSLRRGWQACESRLAAVEAERDAARAGEARAVEALRAVVAAASPHEEDTWTMEGSALRHVHRVLDRYEPTLDNQPSALDWLDQQRREAAAEALERLEAMESTSSTMLPKSASVS